jgi:PPOX class probable F420-dependent enzyme
MESEQLKTGQWTPPIVDAAPIVPQLVFELWQQRHCVMLSTVGNRRPHSSLMWFEPKANHILLSTVAGRQKYKDVVVNPHVSLLFHPDGEWDRYVELRGTARMGGDGRAAIDRMHAHYRSPGPYPWDSATDRRVEIVVEIPNA